MNILVPDSQAVGEETLELDYIGLQGETMNITIGPHIPETGTSSLFDQDSAPHTPGEESFKSK